MKLRERSVLALKAAESPPSSITMPVTTPDPHERLATALGNRALGRLVQRQLAPGPAAVRYEREAHRVADAVVREPAAEQPAAIRPETRTARQSRALGPALAAGRPMTRAERDYFEPRFGADFSDVRLHTGARAGRLSQGLGARAFTYGRDVAFANAEYAPHSTSGRQLLAHELAHVVQQRSTGPGASAAGRPLSAAPVGIQRWTSLGSVGWENPFTRNPVTYTLTVGTQSEWEQHLRNVDDEDEFHHRLFPFLRTVVGEPWDVVTRHPLNFRNYHNSISRDPNQSEIRALALALFAVGEPLDLPHGGALEGGPFVRTFDRLMSAFIQQYQGIFITEFGRRGQEIPGANVRAVAGQSGRRVRSAMIQNAGATAMKGVDLLVTASAMSPGTPREVARAQASETIRNAGRLIRHTLEEHAAAVAAEERVLNTVFDLAWARLPGGGALAETAKSLLKLGFKEMIKSAASDSGPSTQATNINSEFVATLHQLVRDGHMTASDLNDAINGFEAVRRP